MRRHKGTLALFVVGLLLAAGVSGGEKSKRDLEQVQRGTAAELKELKPGEAVEVPFILWGGDVATFLANGGTDTKPHTIFAQQGLNLKLVRKDDFDKQVSSYLKGESPFLRGTMSMLGQASHQLTADPKTTPVVFLQLTWSAGDHMVSRPTCKTLNDLKGKKVVLQKGGPHVGMLNDILRTARLGWSDITVVWVDDVTGEKGPGAAFRKDRSIDCCFAISPDMTELTGGLESRGTGEKSSVKDAHVLVSTAQMSRSIADVYACRKDYYEKHRDVVEKFAAGYLKASEELVELRKKWDGEKNKPTDPKFEKALQMTQDIFGKEDIKTLEDAQGLIMDASFVGLPGNISFFTDRGNLSGFLPKSRQALALPADPTKEPLKASDKNSFIAPNFDYNKLRQIGSIAGRALPQGGRFGPEIKVDPEKTIYTFTISFEPNESKFSEAKYGGDFQRALEQASLFGNTVIAVRGHADPKLLVDHFLSAAQTDKLLTKKGDSYFRKDGTELNPNDTKTILKIIGKENLSVTIMDKGRNYNMPLKEALGALQRLSEDRANAVRQAIVTYGSGRSLSIDASQIRGVGVGVSEPAVGFPRTGEEKARNRRVEFRIIKVPSDAIRADDFNF